MSVLVQEMVNSTYSYVIHTDNPSNKDEMLIEIVEGLGEALVSGSAEYQGAPHRFVYNKINGQIRRVGYADKDWRLVVKDGRLQRELTDYRSDIFANGDVSDILRNLFKQAKVTEQLFSGKPQDIEGCIVKQETGQLETVFVQSPEWGPPYHHRSQIKQAVLI
jgi:phosphoenolpyruvate synthase/pyruvate phosphate dikinase